jgi:hypothetical protein
MGSAEKMKTITSILLLILLIVWLVSEAFELYVNVKAYLEYMKNERKSKEMTERMFNRK